MHEREELRAEILQALGDAWDHKPDVPFGRLLLEALQPEQRIRELHGLDDEWLLTCLDTFLGVLRRRAKLESNEPILD